MPALDERDLNNARELGQKAIRFLGHVVPVFGQESHVDIQGHVRPTVIYGHLCKHLNKGEAKGVIERWKDILTHYGPLTYGIISPVCRAWLWATYGDDLYHTVSIGLCLERVMVERRLRLAHGTASSPPASELGPAAVLFAADGQFYAVDHREELVAWYARWCDAARKQAKPLLLKQFEF